jgi:hypothetical protein
MDYPKDGGVSAIRFYLRSPSAAIAKVAVAALGVAHHDAGELCCQCTMTGFWQLTFTQSSAVLSCGCNGSTLPLYIGPPSARRWTDPKTAACRSCDGKLHYAAVAVGYPGPVPPLGGIEAERAQELAVALRCRACHHVFVAWQLALPAPYPAHPDEEWLQAIQGRFR